MVDISLSLLWTLFTTVPGLVIMAVWTIAWFVGGIAFTRRQLRRDPEGFAEKVLRAKNLTQDLRDRWSSIASALKSLK